MRLYTFFKEMFIFTCKLERCETFSEDITLCSYLQTHTAG